MRAPLQCVPWDESAPIKNLGGPGSEVFRALHADGSHHVAVRMWWSASREDLHAALARVLLASRVSHPALARVEACVAGGNSALRIVSEYVPGPTLEAWAELRHRLTLASAVELVSHVSLAAQAAIRHGLFHHSIQPRNLVIWRHDPARLEVKLLDLALPASVSPPQLGPAHFMAPETLALVLDELDPKTIIDARANVYACGALLYFLTTGLPPFRSPGLHELANAHLAGRLAAPRSQNPGINAALEAVMLRALEVAPARRYRDPAEFEADLRTVASARSQLPPLPRAFQHAR